MGDVKQFKRDMGWAVIRLFVAVVRRLDLLGVLRLGRRLGWICSHWLRLRKAVAFLNLNVAFGDGLAMRRKRQIFRRAAGHIATMGFETLHYCFQPREKFERNVSILGQEHLTKALEKGRGVVLTGGHVGTFTFVAARLSREGFPTWVIVRFPHDPRVGELYYQAMDGLGVPFIVDRPRPQCIKQCMSRLRSNEILHVLIDQKPSRGTGCIVPFFGIPTEMFPGAISMALKTGAAVLPLTIHRRGLTRHVIEIGPEIEVVRTGDRQKDVAVNLARVVKTFEESIRRYPEEWWVISRRWKPEQVPESRKKPLA